MRPWFSHTLRTPIWLHVSSASSRLQLMAAQLAHWQTIAMGLVFLSPCLPSTVSVCSWPGNPHLQTPELEPQLRLCNQTISGIGWCGREQTQDSGSVDLPTHSHRSQSANAFHLLLTVCCQLIYNLCDVSILIWLVGLSVLWPLVGSATLPGSDLWRLPLHQGNFPSDKWWEVESQDPSL